MKKSLFKITRMVAGLAMILFAVDAMFGLHLFSALTGTGGFIGAALITAGSLWNGPEAINVIVRPALKGSLPPGLKIIETNGATS